MRLDAPIESSSIETMQTPEPVEPQPPASDTAPAKPVEPPREVGGRKGLDPTRYGDWEKDGRCIDF